MQLRSEKRLLIPPMILAAAVFLIGINWGLPSRRVDPFLFGAHPVWSGPQIAAQLSSQDGLAGQRGSIGADVDPNPIKPGARPLILNQTDAQRAEILVRYRLYSNQPDEMITFRALATLPKTHGDPRLYQYGGLWIYPVGILLKLSSLIGLVDVRSDLTFYLDRPEAFGRFYIVARLYVFVFAMAGVWAVFWLARKLSGDALSAMFAAIGYTLLPVAINMAHEAKPHLPGAVLTLLALIAAIRYVESASRRQAFTAGALCGAACGMVLTGALSLILLPAMSFFRIRARPPLAASRIKTASLDLLLSLSIAVAIYCVTNPFVIIHLLGDRTLLASNLSNSQAMYRAMPTPATFLRAAELIAAGASPVVAIVGAIALLISPRRKDPPRTMLLIAMIPMLVQFVLLATNKPGEYARFGLFIDIVLMLVSVTTLGSILKRGWLRVCAMIALCIASAIWSVGYVWHFARDSVDRTPRLIVADRLSRTYANGARELATYADPAPYCLPPVNLFDWKIVLLDPGAAPPPTTDVLIKPIDIVPDHDAPMIGFDIRYWTRPRLLDTPISWAAKPFRVLVKKPFATPDDQRQPS